MDIPIFPFQKPPFPVNHRGGPLIFAAFWGLSWYQNPLRGLEVILGTFLRCPGGHGESTTRGWGFWMGWDESLCTSYMEKHLQLYNGMTRMQSLWPTKKGHDFPVVLFLLLKNNMSLLGWGPG